MASLISFYYLMKNLIKKKRNFNINILLYHRVCDGAESWQLPAVKSAVFEKQIEYIKKFYCPISLNQYIDYKTLQKPLPENGKRGYVIVTFDDGYKDNYEYAIPILRKYNVPATFYITLDFINKHSLVWTSQVSYILHKSKIKKIEFPEFGIVSIENIRQINSTYHQIVDKYRFSDTHTHTRIIQELQSVCNVSDVPSSWPFYMSWNEVKEIASDDLFDIGGHTISHPNLVTLNKEMLHKEISEAKSELEKMINKKLVSFAYPFGLKEDFNKDVIDEIVSAGFKGAVTAEYGFNYGNENIYTLPRIAAPFSLFKFKVKITKLGQLYMKICNS